MSYVSCIKFYALITWERQLYINYDNNYINVTFFFKKRDNYYDWK